ncbi:hypothetical protein GGF37_000189 [Kickxella alabastrina]|nr:hypothetical protein GGF37_000189 [Kickxella alabastrina]
MAGGYTTRITTSDPRYYYDQRATQTSHIPTPRILDRYANTQRMVVALPSTGSDTDTDTDHEVVSEHDEQEYEFSNHRYGAAAPIQINAPRSSGPRRGRAHRREDEPNTSIIAFREFTNSKRAGTTDIALTAMLRAWHAMAQDSRRKREELSRMWAAGLVFYRRSLVKRAIGHWREAANAALMPTGSDYERVQMKLASMHYRKQLLGRVVDQLYHIQDVQQRFEEWEGERNYRLVVHSMGRWYRHWMLRRREALGLAAKQVEIDLRRSALRRAMDRWRTGLQIKVSFSHVQAKQETRLLKECLHIWAAQRAVSEFAREQRRVEKSNPARELLVRRKDAADSQSHQQTADIDSNINREKLYRLFAGWHAVTMDAAKAKQQAADFHARTLRGHALRDMSQQQQQGILQLDEMADAFYSFRRLLQCFTSWRRVIRDRREHLLQTRAAQDVVRQHDHRRRRVLIQAWRRSAEKAHRDEERADAFIAAHQRLMLICMLRAWLSQVYAFGFAQQRATNAQSVFARSAAANRANTQNMSLIVRPRASSTCDRSISVQGGSIGSSTQARSVETQELLRRVRDAETKAELYKRRWVDANRPSADAVSRDSGLGWRGRHTREARENGPLDMDCTALDIEAVVFERRHLLLDVFCTWRKATASSIVSNRAREMQKRACEEALVKIQNDTRRRAFCWWRQQLKEWRQLNHVADAKYESRLLRECVFKMHNERCERVLLIEQADDFYQRHLMTDTLTDLMNAYFEIIMISSTGDSLPGEQEPVKLVVDDDDEHEEHNQNLDDIYAQEFGSDLSHEVDGSYSQDGDDEYAIDNDGTIRLVAKDISDGESVDDDRSDQELLCCFDAWRQVAASMHGVRDTVIQSLPVSLRHKAIARGSATSDFEWELVHSAQLLGQCFNHWRQRGYAGREVQQQQQQWPQQLAISAMPAHVRDYVNRMPTIIDASDEDSEDDGPRGEELRSIEEGVAASAARRVQRTALHRWLVLNRGKLFADELVGRRIGEVMAIIIERNELAKLARDAGYQTDAALVRGCLLKWMDTVKARRAHKYRRKLYMKAIAFRWEKQARRSLLTWMQESRDLRIMARVAQRAGSQREVRLAEIADRWSEAQLVKNALNSLRMTAGQQAVVRGMGMRFAVAWNNANVWRKTLHTWHERVAPDNAAPLPIYSSS